MDLTVYFHTPALFISVAALLIQCRSIRLLHKGMIDYFPPIVDWRSAFVSLVSVSEVSSHCLENSLHIYETFSKSNVSWFVRNCNRRHEGSKCSSSSTELSLLFNKIRTEHPNIFVPNCHGFKNSVSTEVRLLYSQPFTNSHFHCLRPAKCCFSDTNTCQSSKRWADYVGKW